MPRYTIIGDIHAKNDNLDKVSQVFEIAEYYEQPCIWLGDMLDTKSIIQGKCLNLLIDSFKKSKLQHCILVGNHDYFTNECLEHSLEPLKHLPNVIVIDKPTRMENMLLLPYFHDLNKFKQVISEVEDKENTILFMHQGVNGLDYGNGFIAENEINIDTFQGFSRVLSGHFHKCQMEKNLVYVGTPFSQSFGESNQSKCIAFYDTEGYSIMFKNTNLPQHLTIEIDCDDVNQLMNSYEFSKDDIHRVILKGKETNIHKFQKKLYPTVKFIEQPTIQESVNNIKETDTPESTFLKWAKDIKKLDDATIQLGLSILKDTVDV